MGNSMVRDVGLLLGRLLLSQIFLLSAVKKIFAWSGTASYMAAKGLPAADLMLFLAILLELAGGLSVLLGWRCRLGALLLVAFLLPTTLIFHSFWLLEGAEHAQQMIQFMKNTALIGGLVFVGSSDPGAISLDRRAGKAVA